MLNQLPPDDDLYNALLARDRNYEGIVFVGVKSTGIFCRTTCPARKPKRENVEFFPTAKAALLASYRPCKRCRPLGIPGESTTLMRQLTDALESEPDRRWCTEDLRKFGLEPSTVRRQFKQRFGMTFLEYARARRVGLAMQHLRGGTRVIDAQLETGYESGSGFRDAFSRIMGDVPTKASQINILVASWIDTPLGPMVAVADDNHLRLLEFVDRRGLEKEIERLRKRLKAEVVPGRASPISNVKQELADYFAGVSLHFETPIAPIGSAFQNRVWDELLRIGPGQTRSYSEIASAVGKPTAIRAVAQANGANTLAILVPCHRVLGADGSLTGYGGGIWRKQWLLDHEARFDTRPK